MHTIIGIDPGPKMLAYAVWDGFVLSDFGKIANEELLSNLAAGIAVAAAELVVEKIASYGMAVGESVFETVFWSGRFVEAWDDPWHRLLRKDVKMHLCGSMRAKDGNIIQALKDRFEPGLLLRQRPKGILKGMSGDCWQALAVCVTFFDLNYGQELAIR